MSNKKSFSNLVVEKLNFYVYLYSHPVTGEVFYVGKGKGNRVFAHLEDASENDKVRYIKELSKQGLAPKIEILVHGLDEAAALRVESSVIDLLNIKKLTNAQSGYKSREFGRMSIEQVNSIYDENPVTITEPAILIRINQAFRYSMSAIELYDYTRGQWRLNPENARKAKYAFAIYQGVIQEVYEVLDWYEGGSTFSIRQNNENIDRGVGEAIDGRYEFVGNLASQPVRAKYKNKPVNKDYFKAGNSNPIMYLNFE